MTVWVAVIREAALLVVEWAVGGVVLAGLRILTLTRRH